MEESFTITLLHRGVERILAGRLRISKYVHQFLFEMDGAEVILEPDDEGRLRAIVPKHFDESGKPVNPTIDPSLVRALLEEMEKIMKA